jgi:hypothetical protein
MSDSNNESDATSLSVRLGSLSREQLQALLERLAGDSEAFAQRIDYLICPRAAVERIATRIRAIRRDDESISYDGLWEVADLVQGITADIERDVLPYNPVQALALAEQVIALDAPLMNRSLDDGVIGDALKEACTLWLKSARAVRVSGTLPSMNWEARLHEVARQDDYGVRACLLRKAHMLFDHRDGVAVGYRSCPTGSRIAPGTREGTRSRRRFAIGADGKKYRGRLPTRGNNSLARVAQSHSRTWSIKGLSPRRHLSQRIAPARGAGR